MHIKWTVAYDGHFKQTIIYLSCFITKIVIGVIVSELFTRLLVDSMPIYSRYKELI